MLHKTSKALLLEAIMGDDLPTYMRESLQAGRGWRDIAFDIRTATTISVSHETLRLWGESWGIESPNVRRRTAA